MHTQPAQPAAAAGTGPPQKKFAALDDSNKIKNCKLKGWAGYDLTHKTAILRKIIITKDLDIR